MVRKKTKRKSMRDNVRKQAKEDALKRSGFNYFIAPDGVELKFLDVKSGPMSIDILPYEVTSKRNKEVEPGDLWYERTYLLHRGLGTDNKSYVCPKTINKPCPICEERARLMKSEDGDEEEIARLKPQERQVFNVINRSKKASDDILLFDYSMFSFGAVLLEEIRQQDEEYAAFADLVDGFTINARFSDTKGKGFSYLKCTRIDFKNRKDLDEEILDEVFDLDEILQILSYEDLEAVFLEVIEEEEDDDEEDSKRDKKSSKRRKPRRSRTDDDDEEDDDLDEDDEEDEEELEEDEDDDDDLEDEEDDEEEDEEEERPKRRKKGTSRKTSDKSKRTVRKSGKSTTRKKTTTRKTKKGKSSDYECPEGGEFGVDYEEFPECNDCELWFECSEANED